MGIQVRIPTPLRRFTGGAEQVSAGGETVGHVVDDLERQFAGIKEKLCDEEGRVRRFVNLYLNGDDIRFLDNLETAVKDGDELSIVPAIAGGLTHGGRGPFAGTSATRDRDLPRSG